MFLRLSTTFCALLFVAGCQVMAPGDPAGHPAPSARAAPAVAMAPFATDGCSMFPDRAPGGGADWCDCCLRHDLAYWRGGTQGERLAADRALSACVQGASGSGLLAALMQGGVRVGGTPYLPTPFRWGFGWPYGRGYQPLAASEDAQATQLRMEYEARNPTLSCSGPHE